MYLAIVQLTSCKPDEKDVSNLGQARIRIINASPDESIIRVKLNDSLKTPQPLSFSQNTGYQNVGAGTKSINTNTNIPITNNNNLNILLKNSKSYSVFVAGKIKQDSLIYITLDDNLLPPSDTTAKIRFVNTSPNSPNLEAVFSRNIIDSVVNFQSTAFRSSTAYQLFKSGIYTIKIRSTGSKTNLAVGANFNIVAGRIYTIWVKGLVNETGIYQLSPALLTDN